MNLTSGRGRNSSFFCSRVVYVKYTEKSFDLMASYGIMGYNGNNQDI